MKGSGTQRIHSPVCHVNSNLAQAGLCSDGFDSLKPVIHKVNSGVLLLDHRLVQDLPEQDEHGYTEQHSASKIINKVQCVTDDV